MTEKIINGVPFYFEKDKNYNGLEYCTNYMYKEDDGIIIIETPRDEKTIKVNLDNGWKKLTVTKFEKEGIIILEHRGKTHIYSSVANFTFPVLDNINDFIRIYLVTEFKRITIEGSCYYDGQEPVLTWANIEK